MMHTHTHNNCKLQTLNRFASDRIERAPAIRGKRADRQICTYAHLDIWEYEGLLFMVTLILFLQTNLSCIDIA